MIVAFLLLTPQTVDLTFVRHGETQANATGKYNSRTLDSFSSKGEQQVAALTSRLIAGPRFDHIFVSPSPRAMKTIAPYLKATRQTAQVWPLLYECCTGRRQKGGATSFGYGAKIKIPAEIAPYFRIVSGADRYPSAVDYRAGLAQVAASVNQFQISPHFTGRILIVGHSAHGGHFLFAVTGKHYKVDNAKEIHVNLTSKSAK